MPDDTANQTPDPADPPVEPGPATPPVTGPADDPGDDTVKVRFLGDQAVEDAWTGRLVQPGQVIEVPAENVYAYTQQADRWAPSGKDAAAAHKAAVAERAAAEQAVTDDFDTRYNTDLEG